MKRKLWIVMALAVLIAAVWCGTAGAEYDYVNGVKYTFEIYDMPVSEFGVLRPNKGDKVQKRKLYSDKNRSMDT